MAMPSSKVKSLSLTNELQEEAETGSQTESIDLGWPREAGGGCCEFGVSRCELVYIGWINNKVPLYSPGDYMQYLVTNHNGKQYKKRVYCKCITESLCHIADINTTILMLKMNK